MVLFTFDFTFLIKHFGGASDAIAFGQCNWPSRQRLNCDIDGRCILTPLHRYPPLSFGNEDLAAPSGGQREKRRRDFILPPPMYWRQQLDSACWRRNIKWHQLRTAINADSVVLLPVDVARCHPLLLLFADGLLSTSLNAMA